MENWNLAFFTQALAHPMEYFIMSRLSNLVLKILTEIFVFKKTE